MAAKKCSGLLTYVLAFRIIPVSNILAQVVPRKDYERIKKHLDPSNEAEFLENCSSEQLSLVVHFDQPNRTNITL